MTLPKSSLLLPVVTAMFSAAACGADKPNILLMMSDDLAATLGCYGHPTAKTPNLDALATRGVLFERAYCQFPHCNPSRSSLLTGLRPNTTRVTNNEDNLYENIPGRHDAAAPVSPARLCHRPLRQDLSSRRAHRPGKHGRPQGLGFRHAVQGRATVPARARQRSEGQGGQQPRAPLDRNHRQRR